jgi:iron complex transport system permease protein
VADNVRAVVLQVRGPRVLAALAVGAALAAAGAAYQNLFRNPLVAPDILGVSAGGALGAVTGIFFGLPIAAVQGLAFAGGLAAVALVLAIGTWVRGHDRVLTLVLTGVVVGSLFGAGIAFAKYAADPYNQLPAITFWLLGSFSGVLPRDLAIALPLIGIAFVPLVLLRWRVNVLSLPDDEARALGVDVGRMRLAVIAAATLVTSAGVAIAGIIGWVGLVVPHAARLLVGAEFARVLPISALLGAAFMLLVDTLCRTIVSSELPPGVLTALVGTPVFIWLLAVTFRKPA